MTTSLLPTRFLFRFSAECRYRDPLWTAEGAGLDESYRLPTLAELEGRPVWADVRAAWSEAGLALAVHVRGKKQPPWRRASRPEDSDCLQVWIDTRDVHNVHRAGRFCHRFVFLAGGDSPDSHVGEGETAHPDVGAATRGAGKKSAAGRPSKLHQGTVPVFVSAKMGLSPLSLPAPAEPLSINRAREQPNPIRPGLLRACFQPQGNDYRLEALIPAEALTGFDPAEHSRLGFTYAVIDRELGQQTFGVGSPMPYQEDPSLCATLELAK